MRECCRCMSVSYDPARRECRLSRYDQTGSRIVYDAEHDYYENLLGKRYHQYSGPATPFLLLCVGVSLGGTEPNIKSQLVLTTNINTIDIFCFVMRSGG